MENSAWEMTHSVETDATALFAWSYWTDVRNWADPPAEFELHGPFAAGTRGTTKLPAQAPLQWVIREVNPPKSATIEVRLDDATLSFEWRFEDIGNDRTRLRQRVVLRGKGAGAYVSQLESTLASSLPEGMNRLALAIANASAAEAVRLHGPRKTHRDGDESPADQ
ncbi:MAG: hypothetical protein JOY54_00265 [Acidobacteriaceae bacterium]|nr:hypothetical protein [Acidobacteriaceae bacterium]